MEPKQPSTLQVLWVQYRARAILALFAGGLLFTGIFVSKGFVNVPEGSAMVLLRKTGNDLPSGQIIATKADTKGIQLKLYPEGWHFLNPYIWEAKIIRKFEIPEGKVGVVTRLFGKSMDHKQVIAGPGQKGILRKVLRPGRHALNPYAFSVKLYNKVSVPPGHLGVVVLVSGKEPSDPNVFVTKPGERGVQQKTLDVGDYYINPFIRQIVPVDVRAHKSEIIGKTGGISFPSKDGFQITMDATIEWYIKPEAVASVFVKYVDTRNSVIKNVIGKIILPFARSFSRLRGSNYLAREFISGKTRQRFQEAFLLGMQKKCAKQGIQIRSALIKNVIPPAAIVNPIKKREITVRLRDQYKQQMEREKQQKKLSIEQALQGRARLLKKTQADVAVALTQAEQKKEVAIINARRELRYAQLRLAATQNLINIILAKGNAKSKVIRLENKAQASGLRDSVKAFGSGEGYVRYLYYQRLARSFRTILSNTNGPFLNVFKNVSKPKTAEPPKGTKLTRMPKTAQAPKAKEKGAAK